MQEKEANLWDYLMVLAKWRRMIGLNFIGVCLLVVLISLFLPKWYTATTSILPPQGEGGGLSLPSGLGTLASLSGGLSLPGASTPSDVFAAILKSRSVAEMVIKKNGLLKVYRTKDLQEAMKTLHSHTDVDVSPEGIIRIKVTEKDPRLAARVANSLVKALDGVNREKSTSRAKSARIFIEERLDSTRAELQRAEERLKRFQEVHKAISLSDQTKAAIEKAADLRAEKALLEIQLGVLRQSMGNNHPQVQRLRTQINEYDKQLRKMEFGSGEDDFLLPFSQVPLFALELARSTRDLKVEEEIFELLTQQYEQAKIQEKRDTPTVQVLDEAIPPTQKSKPKRTVLVGLAGLLSLFVGIFLAFGLEYMERVRSSEDSQKISRISSLLRADYLRLRNLLTRKRKEDR